MVVVRWRAHVAHPVACLAVCDSHRGCYSLVELDELRQLAETEEHAPYGAQHVDSGRAYRHLKARHRRITSSPAWCWAGECRRLGPPQERVDYVL